MRANAMARAAALTAIAATVLPVTLGGAASGSAPLSVSPASVRLAADVATRTTPAPAMSSGWRGGSVTASSGESVAVFVSDAYMAESVQTWADFFAHLVHGAELSLATIYVATPAEITALCESDDALGCYYPASERLIVPGDAGGSGVSPTVVAMHEYGHHVASNRANPPWIADAYGPKRWASYADICARAEAQSVFPGDEGRNYSLNPGEGFAEVYRAINETRDGTTSFMWLIVDSSFYPDVDALAAAENDVTHPWLEPAQRALSGRFARTGRRTWTRRVPTPLDGSLAVVLTLPSGGTFDLSLRTPEGKTLANGQWVGRRRQVVDYTICGQRTLDIRVTRWFGVGKFSVRISAP